MAVIIRLCSGQWIISEMMCAISMTIKNSHMLLSCSSFKTLGGKGTTKKKKREPGNLHEYLERSPLIISHTSVDFTLVRNKLLLCWATETFKVLSFAVDIISLTNSNLFKVHVLLNVSPGESLYVENNALLKLAYKCASVLFWTQLSLSPKNWLCTFLLSSAFDEVTWITWK